MNEYNYDSPICEYCPYTDYGSEPVGTNQYNLCEGVQCEEAYDNYKESNPDDERTLKQMF